MISTVTYISIGLVVVILLFAIITYNKLATKRNQIENAISSTDALFIKRSELIPNLIATVKKYTSFEQETLEKIVQLRACNPTTNPKDEVAGKQALSKLMVQVEDYPELKANTQFINLQHSMNEIEAQISAGRRYISASITDYNNSIVTFPNALIAGMFGFKKHKWQYAELAQRAHVDASKLFE